MKTKKPPKLGGFKWFLQESPLCMISNVLNVSIVVMGTKQGQFDSVLSFSPIFDADI